jgi:hypothetical protein
VNGRCAGVMPAEVRTEEGEPWRCSGESESTVYGFFQDIGIDDVPLADVTIATNKIYFCANNAFSG